MIRDVELTEQRSLSPNLVREMTRGFKLTPSILPGQLDASGRPTLFVTIAISATEAAIAALDPKFVAELGETVAFGERGHAVIVDQKGQALAHPLPEWRTKMRNISKLKPVKAILQGKNGVTEFHSPALHEGMIVGYSVSEMTGWGTMVVQPIAELRASAGNFFLAALTVVIPLTLAFAVVGGWFTARLLARPIERVADAARRFGAGDQSARAAEPTYLRLSETVELSLCFNAMADAVRIHEETLRDSLVQAQVADRAKTAFLANMSHELRTPLNAVIGFSEMMETEMLGPVTNWKYKEYVSDIAKSGRHLLSLINDVLDLSMVEANRLSICFEEVDVAETLKLACLQIEPQAEARDLHLKISKPESNQMIEADQRRIVQILLNLLSNAVRFTPKGGEVSLSAQLVGDIMRFVILDTGIGMSTDQIDLAVQPFGQPNRAADPSERG
ncbi:MAG: sensor histidine kinase, partial [Alphaproteobacteria bacterium]